MLFSIIVAAIAPGISLLAYFYLKDRYHAEPIKMVGKGFILGIFLVFPTMLVQRGLVLAFGEHTLFMAFAVTAGVEEFLKWMLLIRFIYHHSEFDEPYDGIVYAVALSLGFATMENLLYALTLDANFNALLFRALLPVSSHALFGVLMGYYLGKAKFWHTAKRKYIGYSLVLPIFWHGLFDYILLEVRTYWFVIMVPLMVILWSRSLLQVNRANARSPFRSVHSEEEVKM